ncbi:MAG TPA: HAMP domain-containing sensor histidine kinase, partial [Pyrinomonadaceae bacterium]|nr:HAMP domain-containing sensor histidine kinase [Pyrinomonadaceae bacterium]
LIITGLILNTIFLVREIRRSEQHDAFLNSITHELKTPIASIKLYLDTLKTRDVSREKQQEFFDIMLSDTDRLLSTVEQVLDASRTREKKRNLNLEELDIVRILRNAIAIVQSRYNLDDGVIRLSEPSEEMHVVANSDEMQTAFVNLLDNAVKYSEDDKRISVRAKRSSTNRKVDVFIKDNGIGIPPADLKRIFKRFYRVADKSSANTKGTGLGLFIVKSIIQKHGGKLRADSRGEGRGTTFFIQLPLA